MWRLGIRRQSSIPVFDGYLHLTIHTQETSSFLQEVLQADAAHMSFGEYTLYSVYGTNANGTMSALGFALLFGNED